MPGDRQVEAGTGTVRTSRELKAALVVEGRRSDSPYGLVRLRVRLANRTPVPVTPTASPSPTPTPTATRAQALPFALVSAHALLQLTGGRFLSLEDPPSWAADDADRCEQVGWWPCLAGPAGSED
ncbi:MAG TPA: hypothetical protein VHN80_27765, partial [Kineosporiaceae bacterium]|nr:hypothetical protein [Kineosporiaceae bacterium]